MSHNWRNDNRTTQQQQQIIASTYDILDRTTESIQRSNQIAIETEDSGIQVLSELTEQRESLLNSSRRLDSAEDQLGTTRYILRKFRADIIYNRIILIGIIIVEVLILIGVLVLKLVHFK